MSHQRHQRRAFTLVELLVVIGIIAVLVGILLPTLNRARQSANTVKCLANLRSIGQAVMIYTVQYKGSLPYGQFDGVLGNGGNMKNGNASDWATLLLYSMGRAKGITKDDLKTPTGVVVDQQLFACPNAVQWENTTGRVLHYACHPRLMPDLDQAENHFPGSTAPPGNPNLQPYKVSKIRNSSDIALIWDAAQWMVPGVDGDGNTYAVGIGVDGDGFYLKAPDANTGHTFNNLLSGATFYNQDVKLDQAVYAVNKDFIAPTSYGAKDIADIRWRHGKNNIANFVYADGHADTRELKFGVNADFKLRNLYVNPSK